MYDKTDPRSALAGKSAAPAPSRYAPPQYGRFWRDAPQIEDAGGRSWLLRGANFVIAHSEAKAGGRFARAAQTDEYVIILPDAGARATIEAGGETQQATGPCLVMVPPGASVLTAVDGQRLTRLFTTKAQDLVALCPNAAAYDAWPQNIPAFTPWPDPPGGLRIRVYSLDVPKQPGRFGRIFRCTTFMVNFLDAQMGPRDIRKLSPHHHDDFEQCSLALDGGFMHHLRWNWTVDMTAWRDDEHQHFPAPSALVIPPPSIHTSRGLEPGLNQLVDIFCPPRMDFSLQPGWVLNADDYPAPAQG